MRVAQLEAPHEFHLVEAPVPEPPAGEVLVRVEAVGVCGSDLHYYAEGAVGDTPCQYPMVLGHEPAGTVVKTGAGVTGWTAGDRAAFEPAIYCYHCEHCLAGHHNVCQSIRFMSMPGEPGYFREYATLPARNLLPIPAGLSASDATLIEPLAVVLHSMKFIGIRLAETAVVFGCGPIGLLTIACLKLAGAGRVWAVDPVRHRLELAREIGADATIDPREVDPVPQILHDTGRRGVDVAVDCAARGGSMNQCINAARNAGRVVITGIPSETHVPLEFSPIRRKELAIFNVRRSNHESEEARELLAAHTRRFTGMITHTRPLDQVGAGFAQLERYADGIGKLLIVP